MLAAVTRTGHDETILCHGHTDVARENVIRRARQAHIDDIGVAHDGPIKCFHQRAGPAFGLQTLFSNGLTRLQRQQLSLRCHAV